MTYAPRLALALAFALLAVPALAGEVPSARVLDYGAYVARRDVGQLDPAYDMQGLTPVMLVEGVRFVARTTRIEARLCDQFGLRYEVRGLDPAEGGRVTIRVTHPRLTRPDGRSGEVETWESPVDDEPGMAGYEFSERWELASGTWTFAVLHGGRVLAEQSFEVVPAPGASAGADRCGVPVS